MSKRPEVESFSTANFASVAQHDCNGVPHQQWLAGTWLIRDAYSGKSAEILDSSSAGGARVGQNDCYRGVSQYWFVTWYYV